MFEKDCMIDGVWLAGEGAEFKSINPSNGQVVWQAGGASDAQVGMAVKAAHAALDGWRDVGYEGRAEVIRAYRDLLEQKKLIIAEMISRETGKALWDAKGEVAAMIGKIALSEQAQLKRAGTSLTEAAAFNSVLRHKAHGVVAVFGPYNFPCHLPNGHIVPALLAGNCILFKPSELTPKVGAYMVSLLQQAGLPNGVINLLQGEKSVGIALSNADIDGLFFTGSSQTGKIIHKNFAGRPEIMLALEMGGNNPLIVSKVDDIEAACFHIIQSAFISSGQRCTCARRLILPDGNVKADALLAKLVEMTKGLKVGLWDDEDEPYMGPVVNGKVANDYMAACADLIRRGGKSLLDPMHLRGIDALVTPAIIDVSNVTDVEDEEVFAPLLQVYRVADFEAAIMLANDTKYGLSAGIISDDRALYTRYLKRSHAGIINFNRQTTGASGAAPFGGVGQSGNHRPSAFYAADYCAYPIASVEAEKVVMPSVLPAGFKG